MLTQSNLTKSPLSNDFTELINWFHILFKLELFEIVNIKRLVAIQIWLLGGLPSQIFTYFTHAVAVILLFLLLKIKFRHRNGRSHPRHIMTIIQGHGCHWHFTTVVEGQRCFQLGTWGHWDWLVRCVGVEVVMVSSKLVWRFVLILVFWILSWRAWRSISRDTIHTILIMIHKGASNGAIEVIIRSTSSLAFNALCSIRLPRRVKRMVWAKTCVWVLEIDIEFAFSEGSVYEAVRFFLSIFLIAIGGTTIVSHLVKY